MSSKALEIGRLIKKQTVSDGVAYGKGHEPPSVYSTLPRTETIFGHICTVVFLSIFPASTEIYQQPNANININALTDKDV